MLQNLQKFRYIFLCGLTIHIVFVQKRIHQLLLRGLTEKLLPQKRTLLIDSDHSVEFQRRFPRGDNDVIPCDLAQDKLLIDLHGLPLRSIAGRLFPFRPCKHGSVHTGIGVSHQYGHHSPPRTGRRRPYKLIACCSRYIGQEASNDPFPP